MSSKPAIAYSVMPGKIGLSRLIAEGAVEYTPDGFYLIKKPIERFPSNLAGANSVKFILGKGVKLPAGSPGHSVVFSEETGECVTRSFRCR